MPDYVFVCICWKAIMQLPIYSVCLLGLNHCSRTESQKQELEHFLQNINKALRVTTKKKKNLLFANMTGMHLTLAFQVVLFAIVCLSKAQKKGPLHSQEAWQMISKVRHMHKRNNSSSLCVLLQHLSLCYLWHCFCLVPLKGNEGWYAERVRCRPKHETEAAACQYTANSSENTSIDFLGVTPPWLFPQPNAASPECVIVIDQNRVSGLINVLSLLVRALVFKECPSCYL